jgi:hypothetical protein
MVKDGDKKYEINRSVRGGEKGNQIVEGGGFQGSE